METRARIEYRTSADLKQRLVDYAQDHDTTINEVLDGLVRERLEQEGKQDPTETEAKRFEKALRECEDKLMQLEKSKNVASMKDDEAFYFAAFLEDEPYKTLNGDWQRIRFQALEDYRSKSPPSWVRKWDIKSDLQIIEVCRLATELLELRAKRVELRQKLNRLYKGLGQETEVKGFELSIQPTEASTLDQTRPGEPSVQRES
jgi:hypothetical protein